MTPKVENKKDQIVAIALYSVLVALLSAFFLYRYSAQDLPAHLSFAKDLFKRLDTALPHPLFHLLTKALSSLFFDQLLIAGITTQIIAQVFSFLALFKILKTSGVEFNFRGGIKGHRLLLLAVALLLIGPISLFTYPKVYLGYIGINVAHNPTIIVLKPIALWTAYLLQNYFITKVLDLKQRLIFSGIFILGLFAKPCYHDSLVLVITAAMLYLTVIKKSFPLRHLFFWAALSAVSLSILRAQAALTFHSQSQSSIKLCFMCVAYEYSHSYVWSAVMLALSVIFPVSALVYLRKRWQAESPLLPILILHFLGTLAVSLFVIEAGPRFTSGNFTWHPQVSLLVLNVFCIQYLLKENAAKNQGRAKGAFKIPWFLKVLFALQIISGLIFLTGAQHLQIFNLFGFPPELTVLPVFTIF